MKIHEHVERLNAIQCFKQTGLSIIGMQHFFQDEQNLEKNIDDVVKIMTDHEIEVTQND